MHFCPAQGIIPNPAEEALFEELTTELFDTLSAENDNNITNPTPPPGQQECILLNCDY